MITRKIPGSELEIGLGEKSGMIIFIGPPFKRPRIFWFKPEYCSTNKKFRALFKPEELKIIDELVEKYYEIQRYAD